MIDPMEILSRTVDNPAHAYLFFGPSRENKRAAADQFIRMLLKCSTTDSLDAHPDFIRVAREEGAKEIVIKQTRELIERMKLTSARGGKKIALIEQADRLNEESCNTLLKVVEEPAPSEVYIFLAEQPERIPATLRSRLAMIPFHASRITHHASSELRVTSYELLVTLSSAPIGIRLEKLEQLNQQMESTVDSTEAWQETLSLLMNDCRALMSTDPIEGARLGRGLIHAWHLTHSSLSPRLALEWNAVSPYIIGQTTPSFLKYL